ncbi:hypothetical protein FRC11_011063 [Ceratobasidium sp. 423]|nr:hypothetical protein FRC11_011063 [Ceratobasidium sp. 423]
MDTTDAPLRDQQGQWRDDCSRTNPASEGEMLDPERAVGQLAIKARPRILSGFIATIASNPSPIAERLPRQDFLSVEIIGMASSLLGQEGVYAQGLWYSPGDDSFDFFWVRIKNILKIEVREDRRFRGGAKCIWVTTPIAEYAMGFAHPTYHSHWECVLAAFDAPVVESLPKHGYRPDWWPADSSGLWPGLLRPGELPRLLSAEDDLRKLTELLTVSSHSSRPTWRRLGPNGDQRFPGQPAHNLDQLRPWELLFDGGMKATRQRPDDSMAMGEDEESKEVPDGPKRKRGGKWGGRRTRGRR